RDLRCWYERSSDRDIRTAGPYGLLRFLGKQRDHVGMMDHEACAPAVRRIDLADLQNGVEPCLEIEPVAAEARRHKDARKPGGNPLPSRLGGNLASLLCRLGALGEARSQSAHALDDLLPRDGLRRSGKVQHGSLPSFAGDATMAGLVRRRLESALIC